MKYLYLTIGAVILSFLEATIGGVTPFSYVGYILVAGTVLLWLFDVRMGMVFAAISSILLDLLVGNLLGTMLVSFFGSLLILVAFNSFVHLDSEDRRPLGGAIHLLLAGIFNHFLIILQDNAFSEVSWNFIIYNLVATLIFFAAIWVVANVAVGKKASLYRLS